MTPATIPAAFFSRPWPDSARQQLHADLDTLLYECGQGNTVRGYHQYRAIDAAYGKQKP